ASSGGGGAMAFAIEPGRGSPAGVAFQCQSRREDTGIVALPEAGRPADRSIAESPCGQGAHFKMYGATMEAAMTLLPALLLSATLATFGVAAAQDAVSQDYQSSSRDDVM